MIKRIIDMLAECTKYVLAIILFLGGIVLSVISGLGALLFGVFGYYGDEPMSAENIFFTRVASFLFFAITVFIARIGFQLGNNKVRKEVIFVLVGCIAALYGGAVLVGR